MKDKTRFWRELITVRQRICGKVMFSYVFVCLLRGGGPMWQLPMMQWSITRMTCLKATVAHPSVPDQGEGHSHAKVIHPVLLNEWQLANDHRD